MRNVINHDEWYMTLLHYMPPVGPRQANLCLRAFRHDKF